MATKRKSKKVKSLSGKGLTSREAKNVRGGSDLLPARSGSQISAADGSVRNASSVKLWKV